MRTRGGCAGGGATAAATDEDEQADRADGAYTPEKAQFRGASLM